MKKSTNNDQYICKECENMFFHPKIYETISNDERCPYCGSERITKEKKISTSFFLDKKKPYFTMMPDEYYKK